MIEFENGEGQGVPVIKFLPDPRRQRKELEQVLQEELVRFKKHLNSAFSLCIKLLESSSTISLVSRKLEASILKSELLSTQGGDDEKGN